MRQFCTPRPFCTRVLSIVLIGMTAALLVSDASGHVGDPVAERALSEAYAGPRVDVGSADAWAAVDLVVTLASHVHNESGQWLLPPGVVVDGVTWDGGVVRVEITVPKLPGEAWSLSEFDLGTVSQALSRPFMHDSAFGGVSVRARRGDNGVYGTLGQFVLEQPTDDASGEEIADGEFVPAPAAGRADGGTQASMGGPTTSAGRQPTGALSGVTVYCSAGHGWTAGDTSWFLQRPVTQGMCEDYGNIDVLNHFAAFAFNAGATVVPLRPVGWQPIEIVLDQDDPGVTYTGSWSNGSSSKYYENGTTMSGVVYKYSSAQLTEDATARYTPTVTETDFYPVYCFTIASANRTLQTYRVSHSGGVSEVTIDHRETGNGWIWLGDYYLEAGGDNYVEITNESPEAGFVVADAIRWGGGFGDVYRSGPNSTSGYPRDEEGQRYWGHAEWGDNAVGFSSSIWNTASSDQSDNIGTGARLAREMNLVPAGGVQVDRWKRIHLEFHSNAFNGSARGQICLITDLGETTNQTEYAVTLSDEVDTDMLVLDSEFEHSWYDRSSPTLTGSYSAIATTNNSDEFDATLVELAFHDNTQDAELLRDGRVRAAMARSCVQGIIRFLNAQSGSEVPLAFSPDPPRNVRVVDAGGGDVTVSWDAPLSDDARGDPATGYVVYQSSNGYGFGDPIVLGNVLTTTVSGVPTGETRYFRVAATNTGGESMPSETLAAARPSEGVGEVLVVNGYDRLRRQINHVQTFTQPPGYAGDSIERQTWRRANSFDYIVQHAKALAANGTGFSSCANEAAAEADVSLGDYSVVVWILGRESEEDSTFDVSEQSRVTSFLEDGGALFVSGSDLGYDLVGQGGGVTFLQDTLQTLYTSDDAGTYGVTPTAGRILDGLGSFDFNPANGAPYDVAYPDVLAVGAESSVCLEYSGGGAAGIEYTGEVYNVVTFGFPFETITSSSMRADVMQRVIDFLLTANGPLPFDYDRDGDVDWDDFQVFLFCMQGPDTTYSGGHVCLEMDGDGDSDVDVADFALLQRGFTGPGGG